MQQRLEFCIYWKAFIIRRRKWGSRWIIRSSAFQRKWNSKIKQNRRSFLKRNFQRQHIISYVPPTLPPSVSITLKLSSLEPSLILQILSFYFQERYKTDLFQERLVLFKWSDGVHQPGEKVRITNKWWNTIRGEKGEIILNDWVGKVLIIGWNIFQKFWCVHRTLGWYFQSFSIPAYHIIIISYYKSNYHKTLGWYFPFSAENFIWFSNFGKSNHVCSEHIAPFQKMPDISDFAFCLESILCRWRGTVLLEWIQNYQGLDTEEDLRI